MAAEICFEAPEINMASEWVLKIQSSMNIEGNIQPNWWTINSYLPSTDFLWVHLKILNKYNFKWSNCQKLYCLLYWNRNTKDIESQSEPFSRYFAYFTTISLVVNSNKNDFWCQLRIYRLWR